MKTAIHFYEKNADKYNEQTHEVFYKNIADELLSSISEDKAIKNIAEIGAGTGFTTEKIKEKFPNANITAIEPSYAMINHAKKRDSNIRWQTVNFSDYTPESKFDLVISSMAAHWFNVSEINKLASIKTNILALSLPAMLNGGTDNYNGNFTIKKTLFNLRSDNCWPKETRKDNAFLKTLRSNFKKIDVCKINIIETYNNAHEFINSLYFRGAILALFGNNSLRAKELLLESFEDREEIIYNWPIKLIIASVSEP